LRGSLPYNAALAEMMSSDGLMLLQSASCNHQIPAKVYEYIRAGRPILSLTDSEGDTAKLLASLDSGPIAPLDSVHAIESAIMKFIERLGRSTPNYSPEILSRYSRRRQVAEVARLLDCVAGNQP